MLRFSRRERKYARCAAAHVREKSDARWYANIIEARAIAVVMPRKYDARSPSIFTRPFARLKEPIYEKGVYRFAASDASDERRSYVRWR